MNKHRATGTTELISDSRTSVISDPSKTSRYASGIFFFLPSDIPVTSLSISISFSLPFSLSLSGMIRRAQNQSPNFRATPTTPEIYDLPFVGTTLTLVRPLPQTLDGRQSKNLRRCEAP